MVKNYTESLFNDKIILRSQERFKSGHHEVYKEEVNTTLHWVVMMIRDYKNLIKLQHIHTEQMLLKSVKVKWW